MGETSDKGRRELIAMIAIAFLPFLIAGLLFISFPNEEISSQKVREGYEIEELLNITPISGEGKWRILQLVDNTCPESYREALFLTRQTRKALSKHAGEVHRIALTAKDLHPDFIKLLLEEHKTLSIVADAQKFGLLMDLVPENFEGPPVFLIDPLGEVVMFFPLGRLGKPLLKDLRYLLRGSRMG